MRRPPDSVALVARTHWLMGGVILAAVLVLYALVRNSSVIDVSQQAYTITLSLTALYLVTGCLIWWGVRLGRWLSYPCSLLYLVRPPLGTRIWGIMSSDEWKAHFERRGPGRDTGEAKRPFVAAEQGAMSRGQGESAVIAPEQQGARGREQDESGKEQGSRQ